jgi:hypothetical protein
LEWGYKRSDGASGPKWPFEEGTKRKKREEEVEVTGKSVKGDGREPVEKKILPLHGVISRKAAEP